MDARTRVVERAAKIRQLWVSYLRDPATPLVIGSTTYQVHTDEHGIRHLVPI